MNVKVIELTSEQAILNVQTRTEVKALVISKTEYGYSYEDFADWEISDKQYYELEELANDVMDKMSGRSSLNVEW